MFLSKSLFQLFNCLLWEARLKLILWFHVFLSMTVNCCMCLTGEYKKNSIRKKNCRKSHSKKLGYQQIIPVEKTLRVSEKYQNCVLHSVHYLAVLV